MVSLRFNWSPYFVRNVHLVCSVPSHKFINHNSTYATRVSWKLSLTSLYVLFVCYENKNYCYELFSYNVSSMFSSVSETAISRLQHWLSKNALSALGHYQPPYCSFDNFAECSWLCHSPTSYLDDPCPKTFHRKAEKHGWLASSQSAGQGIVFFFESTLRKKQWRAYRKLKKIQCATRQIITKTCVSILNYNFFM